MQSCPGPVHATSLRALPSHIAQCTLGGLSRVRLGASQCQILAAGRHDLQLNLQVARLSMCLVAAVLQRTYVHMCMLTHVQQLPWPRHSNMQRRWATLADHTACAWLYSANIPFHVTFQTNLHQHLLVDTFALFPSCCIRVARATVLFVGGATHDVVLYAAARLDVAITPLQLYTFHWRHTS